MWKRLLNNITGFKLALVITILFIPLYYFYSEDIPLLKSFELKTLDLRFKRRGPILPSDDVVIVAIDDYSIENLGRWPWPRFYYAKLLDKLSADGAGVVGFDFIFSDPEKSPEYKRLKILKKYFDSLNIEKDAANGKMLSDILNQLLETSTSDLFFAKSISRNNNVGLGFVFEVFSEIYGKPIVYEEMSLDEMTSEEIGHGNDMSNMSHDNDMPPAELLEETSGDNDKPLDVLPSEESKIMKTLVFKQLPNSSDKYSLKVPVANEVILPLRELYQGARTLGFFNTFPDSDGVLRWDNLLIKYKGNYYPSFALQLLKQYYGLKNEDIRFLPGKGISLGNTVIPLDEYGRIFINHYGPPYTVKRYSYEKIMFGEFPPGTFKDKIVLIGAAATGLGDTWPTPFAHEAFPGVEKHATVISNILQEKFIYRNDSTLLVDLLFIVAIGLGLGYFLPKFSPIKASFFVIFVLVLVFLANYALFFYSKMWINLVYPVLQLIVITSTVITYKFFTEDKQKRFIKRAFSQYLSPAVIENLVNNPDMLKLGGERKVLTAFFSDVAGFSTISEMLSPEELVELLNVYLSEMTEIILKYGGTVDKYEGDAIIAFFGAPIPDDEHAKKACTVSIEMQLRLNEMRKTWEKEGKPELFMRIGLNTGQMVVGNMGSKTRMDYTMMGDSVNLAARLEGVNKQYGTFTIISEYTLKEVGNAFEVRELDSIRLVGKKEPVKIYELMAKKGDISSNKRKVVQLFLEGLGAYKEKDWQKAITFFGNALKIDKNDNPSKNFLKRCEDFLISPPPDNWDGICDQQTK